MPLSQVVIFSVRIAYVITSIVNSRDPVRRIIFSRAHRVCSHQPEVLANNNQSIFTPGRYSGEVLVERSGTNSTILVLIVSSHSNAQADITSTLVRSWAVPKAFDRLQKVGWIAFNRNFKYGTLAVVMDNTCAFPCPLFVFLECGP